jgi:hypothetical protein
MARRGKGTRTKRVATPAVAALQDLSPGADLLAAISALELSSLPGYDLPLVLRAVYRLGNHVRALLFDVVAEIMRRKDPDGLGTGDWDAVGVHEVRAALAMSRTAANSLNHLAQDLHERLPQVLDAMREGRLDQPRARVFSSWTALLSEPHARAVVDALLPVAPRLTTGELIDEIRRVAIELDPDFARREHDHGRSQRRVRGAIDRDGTGHITAEGLTAEQIAASCDRLDAIGWYLKRAGHPGRLDHIRADVFAGLLTGEFAGLTDEQLIEKLLATMPPGPEADQSTSEESAAADGPATPDEPATPDGSAMRDAASDSGDTPTVSTRADASAGGRTSTDERGSDGVERRSGVHEGGSNVSDGPRDAETSGRDEADCRAEAGTRAEASGREGTSSRPETTGRDEDGVSQRDGAADGNEGGGSRRDGAADGLSSSLERDPAARWRSEPGGGPPISRSPVEDRESGPPPTNSPAESPPRPGPSDPGRRDYQGGGVRLHRRGLRLWVGLATVAGRDRRPGDLLGWSLVHAELARRIAAAPGASWWYVLADDRGQPLQVGPIRRRPHHRWWDGPAATGRDVEVWLQVTAAELAALVVEPPPGWERVVADIAHRVANATDGAPNGDPADRFPSVGLRRFLSIRDRRCGFPGCRVPSHRTDVDHVVDYAKGGPTVDANLVHLCRPDHELKTKHGWRVDLVAPGRLRWTSPLGHVYERPAPRGPAGARPPMSNPAGPEHDWFRAWADEERTLDEDISPIGCLTSDARPRPGASPDRVAPAPASARRSKPASGPEPSGLGAGLSGPGAESSGLGAGSSGLGAGSSGTGAEPGPERVAVCRTRGDDGSPVEDVIPF